MPERKTRSLVCVFCGQALTYEGERPSPEVLERALAHEKVCLKNPYIARIAQLEAFLIAALPLLPCDDQEQCNLITAIGETLDLATQGGTVQ